MGIKRRGVGRDQSWDVTLGEKPTVKNFLVNYCMLTDVKLPWCFYKFFSKIFNSSGLWTFFFFSWRSKMLISAPSPSKSHEQNVPEPSLGSVHIWVYLYLMQKMFSCFPVSLFRNWIPFTLFLFLNSWLQVHICFSFSLAPLLLPASQSPLPSSPNALVLLFPPPKLPTYPMSSYTLS